MKKLLASCLIFGLLSISCQRCLKEECKTIQIPAEPSGFKYGYHYDFMKGKWVWGMHYDYGSPARTREDCTCVVWEEK